MKKLICCSLFYLVFVNLLVSQSSIRLNNYWEDPYFINPASIHPVIGQFSLAGRKQWTGFEGAPTTAVATATSFIKTLHTQFGLGVIYDKIGYTSSYNADLATSYSIAFDKATYLDMGLAICLQGISYDLSQANYDIRTDPLAYNRLNNQSNYNANIGLEFNYDQWTLGASGLNIFNTLSGTDYYLQNTNYLYLMYREISPKFVNYAYGICGIQTKNIYQMESYCNLYFKTTLSENPNLPDRRINAGMYYRTWHELGFMFGIDLSNQSRLAYTYDYNVSSIAVSAVGTHELILTYKLIGPKGCFIPKNFRVLRKTIY